MIGKIIYYICDGPCKRTTLKEPDLTFPIHNERGPGEAYHFCEDCVEANWFWCDRCRKAHQHDCPKATEKLDIWQQVEGSRLEKPRGKCVVEVDPNGRHWRV